MANVPTRFVPPRPMAPVMPGAGTGVASRSVAIPVSRGLADREAGRVLNEEIATQMARREAAKDAAKLAALEATGKQVAVKGAARLLLGRVVTIASGPVGWIAGAASTGVSCYFDYKSAVWDAEAAARIGARLASGEEDPTIGDRPHSPGETMEFPGAADGERFSFPSETATDGVMITEPPGGEEEPIGDPVGDLQAIGDPGQFQDRNPLGDLTPDEMDTLKAGQSVIKHEATEEGDERTITFTPRPDGTVLVRQETVSHPWSPDRYTDAWDRHDKDFSKRPPEERIEVLERYSLDRTTYDQATDEVSAPQISDEEVQDFVDFWGGDENAVAELIRSLHQPVEKNGLFPTAEEQRQMDEENVLMNRAMGRWERLYWDARGELFRAQTGGVSHLEVLGVQKPSEEVITVYHVGPAHGGDVWGPALDDFVIRFGERFKYDGVDVWAMDIPVSDLDTVMDRNASDLWPLEGIERERYGMRRIGRLENGKLVFQGEGDGGVQLYGDIRNQDQEGDIVDFARGHDGTLPPYVQREIRVPSGMVWDFSDVLRNPPAHLHEPLENFLAKTEGVMVNRPMERDPKDTGPPK